MSLETTPEETSLAGLGQAFMMILASEIGDKTFLIAAILAMRHDRMTVFAGAFGSLMVMSVLSAAMGRILPALLPKVYTQLAAAVLFLVFGLKMFQEARAMPDGNEKMQEEMREAEEEIEIDEDDAAAEASVSNGSHIPLHRLEEGGSMQHARQSSVSQKRSASPKRGGSATQALTKSKNSLKRTCRSLVGPVFAQSFLLTFLGEWGDRSQIATIALAAAHNMTLVAVGTVVGHGCCTAVAVLGGRWVSTKISIKRVTLVGSILFVLFAFIYLYEALLSSDTEPSLPEVL